MVEFSLGNFMVDEERGIVTLGDIKIVNDDVEKSRLFVYAFQKGREDYSKKLRKLVYSDD